MTANKSRARAPDRYPSLARDWLDAAIDADLSQNELRIFLVIFRQTLCYSRAVDALTISSLVFLTRIRKDRLLPALARLLSRGLVEVRADAEYENAYSIPADLLQKHANTVSEPKLPTNRNPAPPTDAVSAKQKHTVLDHSSVYLKTTTTNHCKSQSDEKLDTQALPYPPSFCPAECQSAAAMLDGLAPEVARDCLLILQAKLTAGGIKSPLGYLHQLTHAARTGTLNRRSLQTPTPNQTSARSSGESTATPTLAEQKERLRTLVEEIRSLDALFAQAKTAMDARSAARRAAWLAEYNALRAQLQPAITPEKAC